MIRITLVLSLIGSILAVSLAIAIEPYGILQGPINVLSVIDGNTIEVDIGGAKERVHLIGVDTPETVHPIISAEPFGLEASNYTKTLLTGQQVWIEFDLQERDINRRLLAYVYIEDSNGWWEYDQKRFSQVNHLISANGWADTLAVPPNVRYESIYKQSVQAAREAKVGMWANVESEATIMLLPPAPHQ